MQTKQLEAFSRLVNSPDGQVFFDFLVATYVHVPLQGKTPEETLRKAAQHDLVIDLKDILSHAGRKSES